VGGDTSVTAESYIEKMRDQSAEIMVLLQTIFDTLQHGIVRFAEPEFSREFENIEFAIDKSFIKWTPKSRPFFRCNKLISGEVELFVFRSSSLIKNRSYPSSS